MLKSLVILLFVSMAGCAVIDLPLDEDLLPPARETATCFPFCPAGETCVAENFCMEITSDLEGRVCEFHHVCEPDEYCVEGHCTKIECLYSRNPLENERILCYSGPAGTPDFPPCTQGVRNCLSSGFFGACEGEVVPVEEIGLLACNGVDDDCNGIPDRNETEAVDIVFLFDISGSMLEEFSATLDAIRETARLYDTPSVRLALITFPASETFYDEWEPTVLVGLETYPLFITDLSFSLFAMRTSGGREASWDLPWMLANNLIPEIVWRPDAKKVIIMFTDERGQSYLDVNDDGCSITDDYQACDNTESSMCEAIQRENILLYVFTDLDERRTISFYPDPVEYVMVFEDFDDCSTILELTEDGVEMASSLSDLAESICSI